MPPACPQCQQPAHLMLRAKDYNRQLSAEVFDYYCCLACGLIFLFPIPENLGDYYPPSYYQFPTAIEVFAQQVASQSYKVDIVRQFVAAGRLLEIGPGPGDFAYPAKQAGFEVEVIEMDARCCQFLQDIIGVHAVNNADIPGALQGMGKYDVIALWQVIEHLADPWSTLDALVTHLAPNGILVIAAPNPDSFQFRIFRRWWTHLDAPRHVELIPISTLTHRMQKLGLTRVLATTTDKGSLGWNLFGWQNSLRNLVNHRWQMRTVGRIVNRLFRSIERAGLRGSTYTLMFRRPTT